MSEPTNHAHTPGPWKALWVEEAIGARVMRSGARIVSESTTIDGEEDSPSLPIVDIWEDERGEFEANAALIAASPRLLAALQAIMPFAEALLEGGEHAEYQANRDAVTEARAAIAQALGTDG